MTAFEVVEQVKNTMPDIAPLLQLGGMSAVAGVLLWQMLRDRRSQQRSFQSMSLAVLSFQQMLLVYGFTRQHDDDVPESTECKKCRESIESLRQIIERQGTQIEQAFRDEK